VSTVNDGPDQIGADAHGRGTELFMLTEHGYSRRVRHALAQPTIGAIQRGRFGFNAIKSSRMVGVK
jgi:hypothetical protein